MTGLAVGFTALFGGTMPSSATCGKPVVGLSIQRSVDSALRFLCTLMRLFGGKVSVFPNVDFANGLFAGKKPPRPRHVCAVNHEAPDTVDSRRTELCLPARFACVIN